jgi:hypothetical protein
MCQNPPFSVEMSCDSFWSRKPIHHGNGCILPSSQGNKDPETSSGPSSFAIAEVKRFLLPFWAQEIVA